MKVHFNVIEELLYISFYVIFRLSYEHICIPRKINVFA
jgi:hypothetical protein